MRKSCCLSCEDSFVSEVWRQQKHITQNVDCSSWEREKVEVKYQVPSRKKLPFYLSRSVSQTVVETEVDEKWAITEGFDFGSVITLQISDFPSFISRLFIAAAFLSENKMISLRQYNARNNRFGQTFAEAWWAWLTITEFHCGFSLLFFSPSSIYSSVILNGSGFAGGDVGGGKMWWFDKSACMNWDETTL